LRTQTAANNHPSPNAIDSRHGAGMIPAMKAMILVLAMVWVGVRPLRTRL
jgi:hypothetical protein